MPDHYADDIYSDINRKKQLEDAQENKEFDRDVEAYRRGQKNLTDEERLERMKDITAKRKQLKDNLLSAITTTTDVVEDTTNFATKVIEDAKEWQPWWDVGGNIGALGLRAIDAAIPRTPQELQAELVELKAAGAAYPALKLAKEIPIVKKGLGKLDEATINLRRNLLASIKGDQILPDGTIVKKGAQPLMSKGSGSSGLPEGVSARKWFQKVDEDIVKEEVFSQGGTEFQAKQIYRDHQKKLTGKKGIKATIKELNDMWNLWEPNTKIKLVSDTETGGKKMMMMTKTGDVKTWEFDHDHIQAVINTNRPEGGLKGADMADNIEIMFRAMNREKSNVFELDERLLRELGVPYDFKEYIFNKLNPGLVPEGIPQRWKEVFSKSILNDYYELKPNTPSSKHNALMGRLIRKYKKVFTNKQLLADIEYLEDIPFWKKYPPNEIPKWAQILEMPNDLLTDKFWNQLPPKAKKRWENMVRRKHQELKFEMKGYKPSKGRYRIQPDD